MHYTALENGKLFFQTYVNDKGLTIVDIGAQDVNGSLRSVAPEGNTYIGVDMISGNGVDIVISDPYTLPFSNNSVDIVVCSSCFEHCEFFWIVFNEIQRILKDTGLFYMNVPSNGLFHRYPVDCWRFYPDAGIALQKWANKNGYDTVMLESYISEANTIYQETWKDFVAVFLKDKKHVNLHINRIQQNISNFTNGLTYENSSIFHELNQCI